ncbi:MAG: hypothetical protein AAB250_02485 [Bdellovibrionota bacterium]
MSRNPTLKEIFHPKVPRATKEGIFGAGGNLIEWNDMGPMRTKSLLGFVDLFIERKKKAFLNSRVAVPLYRRFSDFKREVESYSPEGHPIRDLFSSLPEMKPRWILKISLDVLLGATGIAALLAVAWWKSR